MQCPACTTVDLTSRNVLGVRVDTCPSCAGMWLNDGELEQLRNARQRNTAWCDIDLWKHDADFFGEPSGMHCPDCVSKSLHTITYNNSPIHIDVCTHCHGIWLDRNEFEKLLAEIQRTADSAILNHYTKTLVEEVTDLFTEPHTIAEAKKELADIVTVLDLFTYKFAATHERLTFILTNLPR